jgi:hypothetical protein
MVCAELPASVAAGVQRRFVVGESDVGKLIGPIQNNNKKSKAAARLAPVAGRGGVTIGGVRSASAADIELCARGSAAAGRRSLVIRGTEEAVGVAEALVRGLVPLYTAD